MTTAPAKVNDPSLVKFVPYGSADEIKLSLAIVENIIAQPTKTGKLPSRRDCLRFIAMCQAKRLNPFEGDAYLLGYETKDGPQFSLITAHQAFLKRAELHPEFDGMESGIVLHDSGTFKDIPGDFHGEDQEVVGGWARVHFKTRKIPIYRRAKLSAYAKPFGVWQQNPSMMICKVAEADALRSAFPTMLGGLYCNEEVTLDVGQRKSTDDDQLVRVIADAVERRSEPPKINGADEAAQAEAGLAPAQPRGSEPSTQASPQNILESMVEEAGFDFAILMRWAGQAGTIKDADSIPDWQAIPSADCERLLRALRSARTRPQIVADLERVKGELV